MLYHHDARNYEAAAGEAADRARTKLQAMIDKGRSRAAHVIDMVQSETPKDYIVPAKKFQFEAADGHLFMDFADQRGEEVYAGMHRHAVRQACGYVNMPLRYADDLLQGKDTWEQELLAHNLNELFEHRGGTHLIRSVDDQVRGFLSNKFRRMDSRPIIEKFAEQCQTFGAVPVEGYYMQTKIAIKALMPVVYEPLPNEVLAYGVVLGNSDYGHGALSLRTFMLRLWCTNYAIADEMLRQVHLGKRLDDNIVFSQKTYELDTATMVSAVEDIMQQALGNDAICKLLQGVQKAHEESISPVQIKAFLKKHFNKGEAQDINDVFTSADVQNLPAGQTQYRLSNAISWIAGQQEDDSRKLEMQQIAGTLLLAA